MTTWKEAIDAYRSDRDQAIKSKEKRDILIYQQQSDVVTYQKELRDATEYKNFMELYDAMRSEERPSNMETPR